MGLDLGLLQAGVDIKLGQDFNAACVHTMEQNGHKAILGDIRAIEPEQLLSAAGLTFGEPFLICGGALSAIFHRWQAPWYQRPSRKSFREYVRMIDAIRPRFLSWKMSRDL